MSDRRQKRATLIVVVAAFSTYFCMYAFRKPFTAATFDDQKFGVLALKSVLVLSQIAGYMLSKFIGVKVISELRRSHRALALIALVTAAELALIGFALLPWTPVRVLMLFLNGLPLGMVFGIVLAYLEGRRQTEALAAGLCASFIVASGVVKSIGTWLITVHGVSEFAMPAITGLIFFCPMLFFVWLLERTPPPNAHDRAVRSVRDPMSGAERREFFRTYRPGLIALVAVYVILTIIRTMRDDFGREIWQDLGVDRPVVFAQSETIVAVVVTVLNALAICIVGNLAALRAATWLMCGGFLLVLTSAVLQWQGLAGAFPFMILCGIGLYIPYVAFHTTVFERLVAASRRTGNLAFLMYLADSAGYLGYAGLLTWKTLEPPEGGLLGLFRTALIGGSLAGAVLLLFALKYFERVLGKEARDDLSVNPEPSVKQAEAVS